MKLADFESTESKHYICLIKIYMYNNSRVRHTIWSHVSSNISVLKLVLQNTGACLAIPPNISYVVKISKGDMVSNISCYV